ncbi:MAG: PEP-CTERM sorting domain-containing protein [Verrucomicrobia bacterium]|nr:MAG: PEP-CTERM sorting domain-containing protein [Verrucomicrobiota bacterium]
MKLSRSIKKSIVVPMLLVAGLAAFAPSLRASTTLLDNTSASIDGAGGLVFNSTSSGIPLLFSTGSTAYSLNSIELAIASDVTETGSFTLSLYSGGTPSGTAIASQTFSGISFTGTATALTENLSDGFSVAANSNYTLLFQTSVSQGRMSTTTTGDILSGGTSGLTYLGRKYSPNGVNWIGPWTTVTPYMQLTGTAAIPEPSALALLGLGTLGLVARRRRVG